LRYRNCIAIYVTTSILWIVPDRSLADIELSGD